MLAFALGIFVKSGGDYLPALEAQARGVRQTLEARGTAQAEAAEAMTAIKIIPLMLIGVTVFLMQDPYFHQFYFSVGGQILLVAVAGLMFVGYQFAQSMVQNVV
jgi:Flp pilus assembly protein TadB